MDSNYPTMASYPTTPQRSLKESTAIPVDSLLSPPEMKRSDSFNYSQPSSSALSPAKMEPRVAAVRNNGMPSPPISPYSRVKDTIERSEEAAVDPPLYEDSQSAAAGIPLFEQQSERSTNDAIDSHMRQGPLPNNVPRPSADEYALMCSIVYQFKSCVHEVAKKDPIAYVQHVTASNKVYADARRSVKPAAKTTQYRVLKPAPTGVSKIKVKTTPRTPRTRPAEKKTPVQKLINSFDIPRSVSPKPPRAPTNRDDVDFESLKDLSPPISTLPPGSKSLKADWKGQMLDLSMDPHRHLLHEAEVTLAATLRLSCATYLCSKRRIFLSRHEAQNKGKEFRKTDAQQACKIDVNKASKLWSAYEKVGWFNPVYLRADA